jgi:hypothetical protein
MTTKLHPIWKQAVADLLELDPQPGHVITEDWLIEHFELPRPTHGGIDDAQKWKLTFLGLRDAFRRTLEEEHSLIFTYVERDVGGMRLLHPSEVADYEDAQWRARIGAEVRRTTRRLKNTNLLQMTAEEREHHLNMLARRNWQAKQLRTSNKAEVPAQYSVPKLPKLQIKDDSHE